MDIFDKVKAIIVNLLRDKNDEVKMDSILTDDLGLDSVDLVELVITLEDDFDMAIPEEDARKFLKTVGDVVKYIQDRQ